MPLADPLFNFVFMRKTAKSLADPLFNFVFLRETSKSLADPLFYFVQPDEDAESVMMSEPLPQPGGLLIRVSRLRFTVTQDHFTHGELILKCVASLAPPGYPSKHTTLQGRGFLDSDTPTKENVDELYRSKASYRKKIFEEQQHRAMRHFFDTWETTARGR